MRGRCRLIVWCCGILGDTRLGAFIRCWFWFSGIGCGRRLGMGLSLGLGSRRRILGHINLQYGVLFLVFIL